MNTLTLRLADSPFGPRGGRMGGRAGHPFLFVLGIVLVAAVVTLAILLYRSRRRPSVAPIGPSGYSGPVPAMPIPPVPPMAPMSSAEVILSERFARGEVSVEDFVASRNALRGEVAAALGAMPASVAMPPVAPSDDAAS